MSGIASRMPIHIYPALSKAMQEEMSGYEEFLNISTRESYIFGYHKKLNEKKEAFVILQAARYQGRLSAEVGISRVACYPYYLRKSPLNIGTFGFRTKACVLDDGMDFSLSYGVNDINKMAGRLVRSYAAPAVHDLLNAVDSDLNMAENVWLPIFEDWQKAEESVKYKKLEGLFPELQYVELCKDFLVEKLFKENAYMRFLGPLRNRYEKKRFFDCHLYLMASGYEFLDPPVIENVSVGQKADAEAAKTKTASVFDFYQDLMGGIPKEEKKSLDLTNNQSPAMEDPILGILKREEQGKCITLSGNPEQRKLEYAFLQSMSALEALSELYKI
ncbi:hypothetical protein IJT93_04820 [bacterium]|nr:hypothetical protein [bacterium]